MKSQSQIRAAALSLLGFLCLSLAALPASAQTLYDNGPLNGNDPYPSWQISGGYVVSDSFTVSSASTVTGFTFGEYWVTGDPTLTVDWSISSTENGPGEVGAAKVANVSRSNIKNTDTFGTGTVTGIDVPLSPGTYWLNLTNATTAGGDPVFWDENSGPSQASQSALGTIPSESFTLTGGNGGTTPEPSSLALFGSGVLGLGGLLRRRFLG